jgi:hypothetical protein
MSFGWSASDLAMAIAFFVKVVKALDNARGTPAEYREAVAFSRDVKRTLEPLHTFTALNAHPAYGEEIREKVEDIKVPIEDFLKAAKKYEASLSIAAKKGRFQNVCKKLQWHFSSMSKDFKNLREKVGDKLLAIDELLQRLAM